MESVLTATTHRSSALGALAARPVPVVAAQASASSSATNPRRPKGCFDGIVILVFMFFSSWFELLFVVSGNNGLRPAGISAPLCFPPSGEKRYRKNEGLVGRREE